MSQGEGGRFRLDLKDERLWDGGQPVRLTRKAFALLRMLVQNPNCLLTREQIVAGLWQGGHVSEGLVREYIHDLRAALDDDPQEPRLIETVRGRGYRFLGGIELCGSVLDFATPSLSQAGLPSLVVLPLDNLGGVRWARFCTGVCDELITDLSRYPDLMVTSRSSSLAHREHYADVRSAGRNLGAGYVLSGSLQSFGDRLRMNLHLTETECGRNVWTERYDRQSKDLFAIQSDIVAHVVSALGGFEGQISEAERRRLGRKPPEDLEAYELYLLGAELEEKHEKKSVLQAFKLLRGALSRDPGMARAWVILAWACYQIALEGWADDLQSYVELDREAIRKAASLDARDPLVLMELSAIRAFDGDAVGAFDGIERALDLGGNQADMLARLAKYVVMVMDQPTRALQIMERSLELNSRPPQWYFMDQARVAYFAGDFEGALEATRRGPDLMSVRLFELLSLAQLGRDVELREFRSAFMKRYPKFDLAMFARNPPIVAPHARHCFNVGLAKAGLD